ncbi:DM13 domain-containing protein [Nocardia sp. XZ_19_385]|uniref:DM13 domain-containing protein n=1 Tax=Nocardia sp. XZ_19_385 TaxID=2769488 RepID=UPI00189071D9|nr:DM13 domain-containing protein [Nocardia sp. XZ_19_385]
MAFARSTPRKKKIALTVAAALVLALGAGLAFFQPWKLVTDTTVNEAQPTAVFGPDPYAAPRMPWPLSSGRFISHEHTTSGSLVILKLPDGSHVLRLDDLDTSDGPDLHVWLTDAPVIDGRDGWGVFDDGAHLDLGKLKGNKGSQNYTIPADADLSKYTSVSIWCDRFNVSFGAATLEKA